MGNSTTKRLASGEEGAEWSGWFHLQSFLPRRRKRSRHHVPHSDFSHRFGYLEQGRLYIFKDPSRSSKGFIPLVSSSTTNVCILPHRPETEDAHLKSIPVVITTISHSFILLMPSMEDATVLVSAIATHTVVKPSVVGMEGWIQLVVSSSSTKRLYATYLTCGELLTFTDGATTVLFQKFSIKDIVLDDDRISITSGQNAISSSIISSSIELDSKELAEQWRECLVEASTNASVPNFRSRQSNLRRPRRQQQKRRKGRRRRRKKKISESPPLSPVLPPLPPCSPPPLPVVSSPHHRTSYTSMSPVKRHSSRTPPSTMMINDWTMSVASHDEERKKNNIRRRHSGSRAKLSHLIKSGERRKSAVNIPMKEFSIKRNDSVKKTVSGGWYTIEDVGGDTVRHWIQINKY